MNKQDMLDALKAKFTATLNVTKKDEVSGVAWYVANVLEVVENAATRKNVSFYVIGETSPAEVAYWKGGEPKPPPGPPTFQQELIAWLDTKIADGTILFYEIVGVLSTSERARVNVTREESGVYVEARLGVYKNEVGDFQYVVIN